MSFGDRLKGAAIGLGLGAGKLREQFDSQRVLRQFYEGKDNKAIVPGNIYIGNSPTANGLCTGFIWACSCGSVYTLLGQFEVLRDYKCPHCKTPLDFLKRTGLADGSGKLLVPPDQWEAVLAQKLEHRPLFTGGEQPRFLDDWAIAQGRKDVDWGGDKEAEDRTDINKGLF